MKARGSQAWPAASVILCAYTDQRWHDMCDALTSVTAQSVLPTEILLVVDHNPALAQRAAGAFSGVRVLTNRGPRGLSGARNTGVEASIGEVLAFLDDDAVAEPDWLARLLAHYADPDVIAVGGAARPRWPAGFQRSGWISATGVLDWIVGCSYTGLPTEPAEVRNLMGCNMSFRRSVFAEIGPFSSAVGRLGTVPLGCEETELCIRARQRLPGARIVFEPHAVVVHHVSRDRLTWSYLRRRSWAEGVSKAVVSGLTGATDALSTERRYVTRVLPAALGSDLLELARGRTRAAAGALGIATSVLAAGAGYLRQRARHRPTGPPRASDTAATAVVEVDVHRKPAALALPATWNSTYHDARVLLRDGRWTVDLRQIPVRDGGLELPDLDVAGAPARPVLRAWTPRVSVIVPTADRPEAVRRCVKSLLGTDYPDLEVLVVDNRPAARGAAALVVLAGEDPRTRYIAERRRGVSRARNTGLAEATGALVAFVDDDIEVDRWWLANLVAELADERIDCATSLVLPSRLDTPAQQKFEELKGFGQGLRRRIFGPELSEHDPLYPFAPGRFGPGGCALWRRSTLLRHGGFDPLLGPGTPSRAGEDLELFLRVALAGGSIVYTPHAVAWHDHGAEWPELRDRLHAYGVGLSAMFVRHLLRHPADVRNVAPMVSRRLRGILAPGRTGGTSAYLGQRDRRLLFDQVTGLASGPLALARSRWQSRREQARPRRPRRSVP